MRREFLSLFLLSSILVFSVGSSYAAGETSTNTPATSAQKKLDGCFVQLVSGDNSRPESDWVPVVADLQKLRLKHLIIQRAEFSGDANYEPAIQKIIAAVNKLNSSAAPGQTKVDVIVGLYMPNNTDWGYNTYKDDPAIVAHIDGWRKRNFQLASSVWSNPEAQKCVEGWYLPLEPWNFDTTTMGVKGAALFDALQKYVANSVIDLKALGIKPVSMSVFANPWQSMAYVGKSVTENLYSATIFKNTGLTNLLIQDSYGAKMLGEPLPGRSASATTTAQALKNETDLINAFSNAASKNSINSWLVLEAFQARSNDTARTSDDPTASAPFEPASESRFIQQLDVMNQMGVLKGAVLFEYLYYLSPNKSKALNDALLNWQTAK